MSEQKTFTTHQEMVAPSLTATQMFEEVGEYKVQLRTILALVAMYLVNACATATGSEQGPTSEMGQQLTLFCSNQHNSLLSG